MTFVRKLCITAIIILYIAGAVPAFMGPFNQAGTFWGIPCFLIGILLLAFGMIAVVFFLYCYESEKEDE